VIFRDRTDAGRHLATKLTKYAGRDDVIVLALPRGGVPVAFEVSQALNAPLDVFLVRKLGVPGHEELAMGAIASGGVLIRNDSVLGYLNISDEVLSNVASEEQKELRRRERAYRDDHPPPDLKGRIVILIDDGLATGSTMRAAAAAVRNKETKRIVIAVPVAARETCMELRDEVDEIVCAATPQPFGGVGMWYADFSQTTDEEVRELLEKSSYRFRYAS
jgi:putative phosphoribosyl transferase